MVLLYEVWTCLDTIVLITVFLVVLTWPKIRGKIWLVLFLLFSILASVIFVIPSTLLQYGFFRDHHIFIRSHLYTAGWVLQAFATIFCLCFVIVFKYSWSQSAQRKSFPDFSMYMRDLSKKEKRSILWRRVWACILDILIVNGCIGSLLLASVVIIVGMDKPLIQFDDIISFAFLAAIMYILFKDSFGGRSIAKALTGLRVIDAATGKPIGPGKSISRNLLLIVPLFPIVELIVSNVRQDKRRLGDLMANTVVIRIIQDEVPEAPKQIP